MIDYNLSLFSHQLLWVGIGCQKQTSKTLIKDGLISIFDHYHLSLAKIGAIATIETKKNERGIKELCEEYDWPLITFQAEKLKQINVLNPSILVNKKIGSYSIAEASAISALLKFTNILATDLTDLKLKELLIIPKQIIKKEGEKGSVTLAVAKLN